MTLLQDSIWTVIPNAESGITAIITIIVLTWYVAISFELLLVRENDMIMIIMTDAAHV